MLKGIDVSSYQGASPDLAGLDFVFMKVTEGLSYVNPDWVAQRQDARAHGVVTGFYHYPHISNSPAAEADHFLAQINLQPGDILCLDWEWYGQSVTDQQARDYKDAWLAYVRAKVPGHRVIVYANRDDWLGVDTDSNAGDGLWIADYVTAGQPRIQAKWLFHQYSDQPEDEDVANFASVADLKAWAGVSGSGGGTAGVEIYPGANRSHWYSTAYPGDPMQVNTIVWHSTETSVLPDYSGGSIAPTLTAVPDFTNQRLVWYQHFGFDESARALVHDKTQIGTNTLNVAQVEIVGTCDPTAHATWTTAGTQHLYMPELPDWVVRDLAAFAKWCHDAHGVPLTSGLRWLPYPQSYGANGVRMTDAQWSAYRGHCGHMHVPQNDHGDPGQFPISAVLAAHPTPTPDPSEDDMPYWSEGELTPGPQPRTVQPPCGDAWSKTPNRKLHLSYDEIGNPGATVLVRVELHDGNGWSLPAEADPKTGLVTVTAAKGRVDVVFGSNVQKISLQIPASTKGGASWAVEAW